MESKKKGGWQYYHTIWVLFFLAWMISYVDRALMTPIISWMIANKVAFFGTAKNAYTLGGLIGGLFFAGYMLVQMPAGILGDKHGNKVMCVLCIAWAGIATFLSGLAGSLFTFVALRVFTGLGEGSLYSNDRPIIASATPAIKMGTGMGIAIAGISGGLVLATYTGGLTVEWAAKIWGNEMAWRVPFFIWSVPTMLVAWLLYKFVRTRPPVAYAEYKYAEPHYTKALGHLTQYAAVFLIIVMVIFWASREMGLSNLVIAFIETGVAACVIMFMLKRQSEHLLELFTNRNLWCLYLVAIAVLWSIWFYGFWTPALVKEVASSSFMTAILTTAFTAGAGFIGYPLGGWVSDKMIERNKPRKIALFWFIFLHLITVIAFYIYMLQGGKAPMVMGPILFLSGIGLYGMQPVAHAMVFENAPADKKSTAFGTWNLIGEFGAVLSPVIAGALRDTYGGWDKPVLVDAIVVGIATIAVLFIKSPVVSLEFKPHPVATTTLAEERERVR